MILRVPSYKPGTGGPTVRNVIYFVAGWHLLGLLLYNKFSETKKEKTSNWDELTGTQKYLSMMSSPGAKLSVINISGTKIQSNKTMTIEEFATTETKKEIFTKAEPKKADCTKPESTKEESAKSS